MKENKSDNCHQTKEKFTLENNEVTLLEFRSCSFEKLTGEELISLLQQCGMIDQFGNPSRLAKERKMLYYKGPERGSYSDKWYAPKGRRIVVGNPEELWEHIGLNLYLDVFSEELTRKLSICRQTLLSTVK